MPGKLEAPQADPSAAGRLESWKEIAAYLKREVRTVQRWEKTEGLPVRRLWHDKQGTVFAYKSEIDAWWRERQARDGAGTEEPSETTSVAEEAEAAAEFPPTRRLRTLLAVLLALAGAGVFWIWPRVQVHYWPRKVMLGVLPFRSPGADPEAQNIAAGLTEEMVSRLGRLHPDRLGIRELSPSADSAPDQIGKHAGVDYVLQGSVRSDGQRVAITTQLVVVKDQTRIWGNSYEPDLQNVIDAEIRVAGNIVEEVLNVLPQSTHPARQPSRETYEAYLTGRYFWNQRTPASLAKAIDYFQRAIESDPSYAPSYAGLADCYSLLGSVPYTAMPPTEAFPKAEAAARKALQIDDTLAEAHVSLGYAELVYERNLPEARRQFDRALELRPEYPTAHQFYAYYLTSLGQLDAAIVERKKAQELDPASPLLNSALGEAYYQARQFDLAVAQNRKSLELDPGYAVALVNLGRAYGQTGLHRRALEAFQKALALIPDDPAALALLGHEYAVSGDTARARQILPILQELSAHRYVPGLYLALIYTGLGDKDHAFEWLNKAYGERCDYLVYLPVEPFADPLRHDERFRQLLQRVSGSVQSGSTSMR